MSPPRLLLLPREATPVMLDAGVAAAPTWPLGHKTVGILYSAMTHAYETRQGSPQLNRPTLTAGERAFEVARQALCTIARTSRDEGARDKADAALASMAALKGDAA